MNAPTSPLRAYRIRAEVTLEQLAAALGVNKSTVLRWEEGQVPAERVLAISEHTGMTPHDLRPDLYPVGLRPNRPVEAEAS